MNAIFFFAGMLVAHIEDGTQLKVPKDPDDYKSADHPHWHVFTALHVGHPIDIDDIAGNAKVIASISDEDIYTVTVEDLIAKGLVWHEPATID